MYLPTEIVDYIISLTDFETAIEIKNSYAIKKLYNPQLHTWIWAAEKGHLEIIKWLHQNKIEGCKHCAIDYASARGHLEVVKFLHNNTIQDCAMNRTEVCRNRAAYWASRNRRLDVLKWLNENIDLFKKKID